MITRIPTGNPLWINPEQIAWASWDFETEAMLIATTDKTSHRIANINLVQAQSIIDLLNGKEG